MEITLKSLEKSKKELTITISVDEMEEYLDTAAKKLSSEMNIKGFRPGNVPQEVVENTVGKEKIWQEAAKIAIEKSYPQAIKKQNLFPVSQPEVEFSQLAPNNPFIYKVKFYTMPEVQLPEYKKIAKQIIGKEKQNVKVDAKEIDETMERIRESRAVKKEVDRKAKKGDSVSIDFEGKIDDDNKIKEEEFNLELGSEQFATLEGFEDQIYDMKAGEKKEFTIEIPKDNPNQHLAGKKITFNLKVNSVKEKKLPQLTDDFAKSLHPDVSGLEELKKKVKEGIISEKKTKNEEALKMKIVQALIKETDVDIPQILVERELDNMKNQLEMQLSQNGVKFDDYLNQMGKKEQDLRDEWRKKAKENVAAAIILHKIAEKENIDVSDEEVEKEVDKHFQTTNRNKKEETTESLKRLRSYIHDIKKNQKIFDFLMEA